MQEGKGENEEVTGCTAPLPGTISNFVRLDFTTPHILVLCLSVSLPMCLSVSFQIYLSMPVSVTPIDWPIRDGASVK